MSTFRTAAAASAGIVAAREWWPALAQPLPTLRNRLGIVDRTREPESVALTFDDGPHPQGTPAVLAALAERNAPATFFVVGEQAERYPELVRAIVDAGHEVGVHGYRHRLLLRRRRADVRADLSHAGWLLEQLTRAPPRLYRPPYGVATRSAIATAGSLGWTTVLWRRWGRDWARSATATSIVDRLAAEVEDGDVLLLHDADHYAAPGSWQATAAAIPLLLDALERRRLRPAALT